MSNEAHEATHTVVTSHAATSRIDESKPSVTLTPAETRRVALGAFVGTAMEWYDFYLFATASAYVFADLYFKTKDPTVSALMAFLTYGLGIVVRPLGALILGNLGDRIGRRKVLMITLVGLGVVTGLIGLLPTLQQVGALAPLLLLLLRILQGLFVSGEWAGAMTIVVENAPLEKRGRYSVLPQLGSPVGFICSSGGFALLLYFSASANAMDFFTSWGWRIPFLLAFPLLGVAIYLRKRLNESPVFKELQKSRTHNEVPVKLVFRNNWRQILIGVGSVFLVVGVFTLNIGYLNYYGHTFLGLKGNEILTPMILFSTAELFMLVALGRVVERWGASRLMTVGSLLLVVTTIPAYLSFTTGTTVGIIGYVILSGTPQVLCYAAMGNLLTGLFPPETRYTGVGLAQNLAGGIAAFTPALAIAVSRNFDNSWWPACVMVIIMALISTVCAFLAPRFSVNLPGFKH